jgi:hypothetical protein
MDILLVLFIVAVSVASFLTGIFSVVVDKDYMPERMQNWAIGSAVALAIFALIDIAAPYRYLLDHLIMRGMRNGWAAWIIACFLLAGGIAAALFGLVYFGDVVTRGVISYRRLRKNGRTIFMTRHP